MCVLKIIINLWRHALKNIIIFSFFAEFTLFPFTRAIAESHSKLPAQSATITAQASSPIVAALNDKINNTQPANLPVFVNQIVAYVNQDIITSNELNAKFAQVMSRLQSNNNANNNQLSPAIVKQKVLEQLILEKIQLDLAKKNGIKTSDSEIDVAIEHMCQAQHTTLPALKAQLLQDNMDFNQFRQQLSNEMIIEKLKQRDVDSRVVVSDDEVKRVLNSLAYKNKIDYNLSYITIELPMTNNSQILQQKEQLAKEIYGKLEAGQDFTALAMKYSNAANALSGGELGWRSSATLPPIIAQALQNVTVGRYSQIVRLPLGFFIFKVNNLRQHGMSQLATQYHVRHILIKVNDITTDNEAKQKITDIYQQLTRAGNNLNVTTQTSNSNTVASQEGQFMIDAKAYSQDASSINGGDLGWLNLGDTVPLFEQIMRTTPVYQISQPFRTNFGWHILQVLAVRQINATDDQEKLALSQELRANKIAILYEQWLRDIREAAYVKLEN